MKYEYKVISLQPFALPSDPKYTFRSPMNGWERAEETEKAIIRNAMCIGERIIGGRC
jgi:hypothetical protein